MTDIGARTDAMRFALNPRDRGGHRGAGRSWAHDADPRGFPGNYFWGSFVYISMGDEKYVECELCGMTARQTGEPVDTSRWALECLFCGWHFWSQPYEYGLEGGCKMKTCEELNRVRKKEGLPPLEELAPLKPLSADDYDENLASSGRRPMDP